MLRVTQSVSAQGATRYFDEALARGDYYTEQDRSIGTWGGKAALQLGLSGQVQREDFIALALNADPGSGERLTARTKTTGLLATISHSLCQNQCQCSWL